MAQWDVLHVDLPPPPGGRGHEQAGYRRAVAVQADGIGAGLQTILVVPTTGELAALRFPHTIRVEPSATNGLTMPTVILVFQLRALDRSRILGKAGCLESQYVRQLIGEMRSLLGL